MILSNLDSAIVVFYLLLSVAVGIWFSRKGTKNIQEFFVSGRNLPWWLAGTTMIASAFAIDTPIGIAGMVADHGIAGVWYAWSFVMGGAGMLGAFIFAALLRRSNVISLAEIAELRYSGRSAAFLRGFKGVYFGVLANGITLAWIIKAVWILAAELAPGVNRELILAVVLGATLVYTAASGLWGIAATDFIQFFIGSVGSLVLAFYAWDHVGGAQGLVQGLTMRYGAAETAQRLSFFPDLGTPFFVTFLVFLTLKWWGNPPPAILQRIIASKDEKHAARATFFFAIVAFGFNYWPMIVAALCALVMYPAMSPADTSAGIGYARMVVQLLPSGVLGLMIASMLAAFMSTVDTHINYGASFIVNDLYRRFMVRSASDRHYVRASQVATVLMLGVAVLIAYNLDSVANAWLLMSMLTAGYGIVTVARWFWWRVNAWSEIATLAGSFAGSVVFYKPFAQWLGYSESMLAIPWGYRFLITTGVVSLIWIVVTLLTPPSTPAALERFCRQVRPYRPGWGPVAAQFPDIVWTSGLPWALMRWALGCVAVFAFCFGIGSLIFGSWVLGTALLAIAAVLIPILFWHLSLKE